MITNGGMRPSQNSHGRGRQVGQLGLLILVAIIVGGCTQALERNAGKTARYEVSGDSGAANNVTYEINKGQQQDIKVALHLRRNHGQFLWLQNGAN